ncbi:hypothetical protein Cgig2_032656 [Carnegiea gigantea]|uniref:DUF4283 domain-containing protein n=1 Tax=Carnegiea gigantea TaxID=171969 RepID=A0A9Q1GL16_9CARY|nr:hypothetical protein Cgig2_032656 [Carnegiea gigantea]
MEINTDAITSLPIWVQFPELDIKYWGLQSLSKLGSMLGIALQIDKFTKLLVEMPLEGSFLDYIEFANERNALIRQNAKYECIPLKCSHCKMFGHIVDHCRRKEPQRREWRVKEQGDIGDHATQSEQATNAEGDGFQGVATRHTIRTPIGRSARQIKDKSRANAFQLLL